MRLRLTFAKTAVMRFTSHLDLHRTWERTFRRARLPLAYSQGFNPHPRLNLASSLPLGFTGEAELLDAWLERELPLDEIEAALVPALPPGLEVLRLESVDLRLPAMQTLVQAAEYTITLLEPVPDLEARVQKLLAAGSLPRRRREKDYDLRPLVYGLRCLPDDAGGFQRIWACLSARESALARPDEALAEIGIAPTDARAHRTCLLFEIPEANAAAA